MANFVAIVDPNPERRARYVREIVTRLPLVDGLSTESRETGSFHVSWASRPDATLSVARGDAGCGVLWGEAFPRESAERETAPGLLDAWSSSRDGKLPLLDGFHAMVLFHPERGLAVSADPLGIFPVYFWARGNVILVGSSQELFRHHPLFDTRLNLQGLVGILLLNNLFDGQTLWEGVRRLAAGHELRWRPGADPKEIRILEVPRMGDPGDRDPRTLDEQIERIDRALGQAVRRHAPPGLPYSMLLSGGLDSRMIAGYLSHQGSRPAALTLGGREDLDMFCAKRVAAVLGLEHDPVTVDLDELPRHARLTATWEHLSSGCNTIHNWGVRSRLLGRAPNVVTGYFGDQIVGALNYHLPTGALSFDTVFLRGVNRWAVPVNTLERLLRREVFGDLVPRTIEATRRAYDSLPADDFHKAWWFEILGRQRFHVGIAGWNLSFGAWPVFPILDVAVLEATAALPAASLAERVAQNRLLSVVFPELARLPLDRNNHDLTPLDPGPFRRVLAMAYHFKKRRLRKQCRRGIERRYYHRIFDIRHEGWQAVRREAEPGRRVLEEIVDAGVLAELLPPPERPIEGIRDGIVDASKHKLLLGLMLWAQDHL